MQGLQSTTNGAMLVAEAHAPGLAALPQADVEVAHAAKILSSFPEATVLRSRSSQSDYTTVQSVVEQLPQVTILHLACHGEQHPTNPLESGFCLRDGRLTIA